MQHVNDTSLRNRFYRGMGLVVSLVYGFGSSALIVWLILNEDTIIAMSGRPELFTLFVPTVISIFKAASPTVMGGIVRLEPHAKSETRFKISFLRIFLVKMFYLMIVLYQSGSFGGAAGGYVGSPSVNSSQMMNNLSNAMGLDLGLSEGGTASGMVVGGKAVCRETLIGVTLYKLIWVQFVFAILFAVPVPWLMLLTDRHCCKKRYKFGNRGDDDEMKEMMDELREEDKIKRVRTISHFNRYLHKYSRILYMDTPP